MQNHENPVLKYDAIFKTLKTNFISDINNVLLDKFKPIMKEIENDISIFLLIEQLNQVVKELPIFKELDDKYNGLLEGLNNNKNELQMNMKSLSIAINDIGHIDAPWKQTMLSKLDNLRIHIASDIQKIDGAINEFNSGRNEIDAKATELLNDIVDYMLDMDV